MLFAGGRNKLAGRPHQRGIAQPGSALVWGTSGRRFKSGYPDQFIEVLPGILHNCYGGRGCAGPERLWPGRLVARTLPFQGREAGSEPVRATILNIYFFHLAAILSAKLCKERSPST